MASSEQEKSLRALLAGEALDELIFDPMTDGDTQKSCLGCLWSLMATASVLVGLYAADHYQGWNLASNGIHGGRLALLLGAATMLSLTVFTFWEMLHGNEVYVLNFGTAQLEMRHIGLRSTTLLQSWPLESLRRFVLQVPEDELASAERPCLEVVLQDGQQIRLLEASYPRDFVEQVERRLAELCGLPSTT